MVSPPSRSTPQRSALAVAAVSVAAVLVLGGMAVLTRADPTQPSLWWLASGVAIGLGCRLPRTYFWPYSVVIGAALYGVFLISFGTPLAALAASIATVAETAAGIAILRAGRPGIPTLRTTGDLGRLLIAVLVSATVFDLILILPLFATGQTTQAILHLATAGPRHAAGALLAIPFALTLPTSGNYSVRETGLQLGLGWLVAALVFLGTTDLPLAFVVLAIPVWSAFSLPVRRVLIEVVGILMIAAVGSWLGRGPFSFGVFSATAASALLQLFALITISLTLLLGLTVARERSASQKLEASELTYRRNFENSLAATIMLIQDLDSWQVIGHNQAAEKLLPSLGTEPQSLEQLLGKAAAAAITDAIQSTEGAGTAMEVLLPDSRYLQLSVVGLELDAADTYAVQMLDITDSVRAQNLVAEELNRAREVQRALAPSQLPPRRGWDHAGMTVTARQVGGDFYDLRISGSQAIMVLGDVMGKGVGAGILAAAARTALRATNSFVRASEVLAESARIIDDDLTRTSAFVTVGYAVVDLISGRVDLADAGHGLTFVLRESSHQTHRLASHDLPVGLGDHWETLTTQLAPGDSLLMVSDGVLELWGDSIQTLIETINLVCFDPQRAGPQQLVEALCAGRDPAVVRTDDATAVLLHRETGAR